MKALIHKHIIIGLALGALVSAGCSDVAFSPANLDNGTKVVDTGSMRTEYFLFNNDHPLTKVDVVFVVDNSMSMADEQAKMASRLSSFIDSLAGVDWQIGITTTDMSADAFATNGKLVTMAGTRSQALTKATPNYEQVFLDTVLAHGTPAACATDATQCPSGDEQPHEALRQSILKRDTDNAGFFRPGADFVAIVLSDEDEKSTGSAIDNPTTPEAVIATAASAWGSEKSVTGYGIVIQPWDSACLDSQAPTGGQTGDFVQHFAEITGGETGSICATDYGPALASIGKRVMKLATNVLLSAAPIPNTVTVTFIPAAPNITWSVSGRTIRLSDLPPKGTRVVVTYKKQ